MKAITNLEKLLSGDESVKPVARIEQIVKGIDVKPITRFEQIVCGYDIPPMNRLEQIVKGLDVGGYRSREEYFWGEWASGHGEIEYVGAVPFSVIAKGGAVSEWQIWGNAPFQEWTPTPDNPCEVKGVGERTGNLLDFTPVNIKWAIRNEEIKTRLNELSVGTYSITINFKLKSRNDINDSSQFGIVVVTETAIIFSKMYNWGTKGEGTIHTESFSFDIIESQKGIISNVFLYGCGINGVGSTGEAEIFDIMLNEGSESLPYEPYGYKTTVVDEGKNYFNPNGEYVEDINCYRYFISGLNPDKQYVCSTDFNSSTSNASIYFNGTSSVINGVWSNKPIITKPNSNGTLFVQTRFLSSGTDAPLIADKVIAGVYHIQIEEGSTPTEFEPYRPPIETTIYHDEPYFTNDYIRKDKNGGVEHREWKKRVLTGNEYAGSAGSQNGINRFYINGIGVYFEKVTTNIYSTHFKGGTFYTNNAVTGYDQTIYFSKSATVFPDVATFKSWLKSEYDAGHPVTIYYQLATPTDTPKDLPEILLVNGYNSIDTDTQIKPEKMSITYKTTKERAEYDLQLTNDLLDVMKGM